MAVLHRAACGDRLPLASPQATRSRARLATATLALDDLNAGSGVAFGALANPSFMDNVLRQVAAIRDEGVFTDTVTADREAPSAATRDIAAVVPGTGDGLRRR